MSQTVLTFAADDSNSTGNISVLFVVINNKDLFFPLSFLYSEKYLHSNSYISPQMIHVWATRKLLPFQKRYGKHPKFMKTESNKGRYFLQTVK